MRKLGRKLVPAFTLLGRVLAWRCNVCDKLFVNPLEDAEGETPPSCWTNEFRRHLCAASIHHRPPLARTGSDSQ
jgi:hypothetical protein